MSDLAYVQKLRKKIWEEYEVRRRDVIWSILFVVRLCLWSFVCVPQCACACACA